jgi:prepilin-type N-terminal cleavage/methylation domain-containing protein
MNKNRWSDRQKGFTMLELLVVVGILGVLVAIAVPNILGNMSAATRTAALEEEHNVLTAVAAAMKEGGTPLVADYATSGIIPAKSGGAVPDNDPGKYLSNSSRFEWTISTAGVLEPGDGNPLNE